MFQKDGLTYIITQVSPGFVALDGYEGLELKTRITYNFSSEKEVEEIEVVEKENLVVERVPGEKEGDAPQPTTINKPLFEEVKTGKMIANENYCEPTIEAIIHFVEKKFL